MVALPIHSFFTQSTHIRAARAPAWPRRDGSGIDPLHLPHFHFDNEEEKCTSPSPFTICSSFLPFAFAIFLKFLRHCHCSSTSHPPHPSDFVVFALCQYYSRGKLWSCDFLPFLIPFNPIFIAVVCFFWICMNRFNVGGKFFWILLKMGKFMVLILLEMNGLNVGCKFC